MSDPLISLKLRFRDACAIDLDLIERELDNGGQEMPAHVQEALHKLSGAAGVFGFAVLSQSAARIDDQLANGGAPSVADLQRLTSELWKVCAWDETT